MQQWRDDLAAIERTEKLLVGSSESATDKKRREINEAVQQALQGHGSLHYREIAVKVSAILGREIKQNAMYNHLTRAIERSELPIQKGTEAGHFAWAKGPGDADGVPPVVSVQN